VLLDCMAGSEVLVLLVDLVDALLLCFDFRLELVNEPLVRSGGRLRFWVDTWGGGCRSPPATNLLGAHVYTLLQSSPLLRSPRALLLRL